jgi:hypothetical protein
MGIEKQSACVKLRNAFPILKPADYRLLHIPGNVCE